MNIIEKTYTTNGNMDIRKSTSRIILHHAAIANCTADDIDRWHKNKGYSKIGYHFFVTKDGDIYRGREENMIGAHAYGANYNSIGICAEGNFQNEKMNDIQKNSLKELVSYLKQKYNIDKVEGHSGVNATACPGSNFPFNEIANASNNHSNNGNDKIKSIQSTLNSRYSSNINIDGIFGPDTKKLFIKGLQTEFNNQFKSNLDVDGIFGSKTKKACPVLKKNDSGNITYLVQAMLFIKGYNIEVDGIYGDKTIKAVKSFQKSNKLAVDGLCGKNTFEKLFK